MASLDPRLNHPHSCIGAMSGTSLDGVDVVRVRFGTDGALEVVSHLHRPFDDALKSELLALNRRQGVDELHRAAAAANRLADAYAGAILALRREDPEDPAAPVLAVGAHGQTVRHQPPGIADASAAGGYTLQLLNGARLAERCGLDVIADFRSRDLAAGGQGAPLVPAFHARCFGEAGQAWAVLNLGGIGNLSLGAADGSVGGFDCGPGNALLDDWCQTHRQQPYDAGGAWAASGSVRPELLNRLLSEPYLALPPPKSTGRDLFHREWLARHLQAEPAMPWPAEDVQATLSEYTARCAADALTSWLRAQSWPQPATEGASRQGLPQPASGALQRLLVCGGGALNTDLMGRLSRLLPGVAVVGTDVAGLPPMQVEAAAFAWLAQAFLLRRPGNLPAVTGASGFRVLGALHPA